MGKCKGRPDTARRLLVIMSSMGLPIPTRFVALAKFHLQDTAHTIDDLAWASGMTPRVLRPHIDSLAAVEILVNDRISVPLLNGTAKEKPKAVVPKGPTLGESTIAFLDEYDRLWTKRYSQNCFVSGKGRTSAREFVKEIGAPEAMTRLKGFMADNDQWLTRNAHPIAVFFARSNQYHGGQDGKEAGITEHGESFDREVEEFEERQRRNRDK